MRKKQSISATGFLSDNLKSKTCPEPFDSAQDKLCRRIKNLKWGWIFAIVLRLALFGAVVEAQQPAGKIWRIGYLIDSSVSDPVIARRRDLFRQGLRDLGYVEGKNINIEYRYAEGKSERLAELAEELVRLKVDILVVSNDRSSSGPEIDRNYSHRHDEFRQSYWKRTYR